MFCNKVRVFCAAVLLVCSFTVQAQVDLDTKISGTYLDMSVVEFLQILENKYGISFYYHPSRVPYYSQSFTFSETPLWSALESFLEGSGLDVIKYEERGIVLANKHGISREQILAMIQNWEDGTFQKPVSQEPKTVNLSFGDSSGIRENLSLQGKITDQYSGDPIVGVIIQESTSGLGASTDENGDYTLSLMPGSYRLSISYLGYRSIDLALEIYKSSIADLELEVQALNLNEVVIEATEIENKVESTQLGLEAISMKRVRELPAFLGEADVIKSLERLPGVSTAGEASAGFNVRGGNIDQNLILLDDALVFNSSHVLGLFSIFNPDAVRNVSLFKGNIPSQFGGRLSSVLQVNLKSGDKRNWHGSGGIGLASSRIVIDGPLVKDKTSILLGARASYSSWMLKILRDDNVRNSRVFFADLVAKIDHTINERQSLSATGYLSYDYFQFSTDFGYNWKNLLGSIAWRFLVDETTSIVNQFSTGDYDSEQFTPGGAESFLLGNGIRYIKNRTSLSVQRKKHFINMGIDGIRYQMAPETLKPFDGESFVGPEFIPKNQGWELSAYINDEINVTSAFSVSLGIRYSRFLGLGPTARRTYRDDAPRSPASIISENIVAKGDLESDYQGIEPRIGLSLLLAPQTSIKLSYNRINQYVHLISNTASPTPIDIWQLSTSNIAPQRAHNFSLGYFQNIGSKYGLSLEGFYKQISDLPLQRDLPELILNSYIEVDLIPGQGRSHGAEILFEKKEGKWSGNVGYTYSRSLVRTTSVFREDIVNDGDWFPSSFDQPHQLTIDLKHQLNPVQSFQINFTYKTGRPITVPVGGYAIDGIVVTHFSDRNIFRVPAYHRLDFGYTIDKSQSKLKGLKHSVSISMYNLYSRKNAFSVFFRRDSRNIQRSYRLAVLASAFPSLTWNFSF